MNIFKDKINSEVWFTEDIACLDVRQSTDIQYSGTGSIQLSWDKQKSDCPWLGLGFGWDNWSGKDLSSILETGAIQLKAFSKAGPIKSLPLAAALEDYTGLQAWIGFSAKSISYVPGEEWATITLPLSEFGWDQFGADIGNIKQMIIQFEANGEVYFDDIKIVAFEGIQKKQAVGYYEPSLVQINDGRATEKFWENAEPFFVNNHRFKLASDDDHFYVFAEIVDPSPYQNKNLGADIWNGDALEIAFSTDPDVNKKRNRFLYADQQVGFKASKEPYAWNWRRNEELKNYRITTVDSKTGYFMEIKISFDALGIDPFRTTGKYGLEIAVDEGNSGGRAKQSRWNSFDVEGFHTNPALWGELIFKSN